jgi:NADP-dependent 3-hydroxy acid dehydrogenase YdfG
VTNEPLNDKVAFVTGASSGIGRAIACSLAGCSSRLALVGRRVEALKDVSDEVRKFSPEVRCYECDLADYRELAGVARAVQTDFGGVDIVVHSAGGFVSAKVDAASQSEFEYLYRVNLLAPCELTRLLASSLRSRNGQVVFINSSIARGARAGLSQYAATKSGLKSVADAFREEFNQDGVRVISIFVGRTATPMQKDIFEREGREYKPEQLLQPADIASVVINCLCLPPTAEVTEIDIRPMMKL